MNLISKQFGLIALILIITFIFYIPSLNAEFTNWDDDHHLVSNYNIRSLEVDNIKQIFTDHVAKTYIPLSILSFAIEYHFFKLNPFVYHFNNLILHLIVTLLVFFLAKRFGLNLLSSFIASLLFGVHPIHVESVAWISERKDVLCAVFYFSAMLVYFRYLDNASSKWIWYGVSILLSLLSILAKPMAYSLPFALLIIDWFSRRKLNLNLLLEKIPHTICIFLICWFTFSLNKTDLAYSISQVPLIWIHSFMFYIYKFFIPTHYLAIYAIPEPVNMLNSIYPTAIMLFFVLLSFLICFIKQKILVFSMLFYLFTISIIVIRSVWDFGNITILADRFMYIPSLGICIAIGYYLNNLASYLKNSNVKSFTFKAVLVCLLIFLSVKTYQQCFVWKNNVELWSNVIKYNPNISRAYINRAQGYINNKEYDLALKDLNQAYALDKNNIQNPRLFIARGLIHYYKNNPNLALNDFNQALEIKPHQADALINRGNVYRIKNEYEKAKKDFYKAILIKRESPKAYLGLARIYKNLKEFNTSLKLYQEALILAPQDSIIQNEHKKLQNLIN